MGAWDLERERTFRYAFSFDIIKIPAGGGVTWLRARLSSLLVRCSWRVRVGGTRRHHFSSFVTLSMVAYRIVFEREKTVGYRRLDHLT